MTKQFKPLLAATVEKVEDIRFPVLASPKLDGVRAIVIDGVVMSRSLKPIPNKHVQKLFGWMEGFDGELIVGDPTAKDVYQVTTSGVMSVEGEPDVCFWVFDLIHQGDDHFSRRLFAMEHWLNNPANDRPELYKVRRVPQEIISNPTDLDMLEEYHLRYGYEGVMLRDPNGRYKCGRSTLKEGILLKLKRFQDDEAEVVGVEELLRNGNEAKTNELGHTERSSHKANMIPSGTLGALICKTKDGVEFRIGTGLTQADRDSLWAVRDTLPGKLVKFKYFTIGVKVAPRFPVFLGFRDPIDL